MAFELTPVSAGPIRPEPGEFLQWQFDGVNLGDNRVAVVDIVGDPDVILASRGFGENSHVITIRKVAGPVVGYSIGWSNPLRATDGAAVYAHANAGTASWGPNAPDINEGSGGVRLPRCGIVGYDTINSPPVVWTLTWAPLAADAAPGYTVIGSLDGDEIRIDFANIGFPDRTSAGLLTISATVDGVPTVDTVQMAVGAGSYNTMAWGPTP